MLEPVTTTRRGRVRMAITSSAELVTAASADRVRRVGTR